MKYKNESDSDAISRRADEIELSIIDDMISNKNEHTAFMAFSNFIQSEELKDDELNAFYIVIKQALQSPFSDRHKPINALICRSIEWQAERLAKLEQE